MSSQNSTWAGSAVGVVRRGAGAGPGPGGARQAVSGRTARPGRGIAIYLAILGTIALAAAGGIGLAAVARSVGGNGGSPGAAAVGAAVPVLNLAPVSARLGAAESGSAVRLAVGQGLSVDIPVPGGSTCDNRTPCHEVVVTGGALVEVSNVGLCDRVLACTLHADLVSTRAGTATVSVVGQSACYSYPYGFPCLRHTFGSIWSVTVTVG